MKKLLAIIALTAAVIATSYSCKKAEPAKISDLISEISYESAGGSKTVTFTTNYPWTASSDANWVTIDKASGDAGKASISVTVGQNGTSDRTAHINITCAEAKASVTVTQKQKDEISISETSKSVGSASGSFNVTVKTNVGMTVEIPASASWLSYEETKAMESKVVKINYKNNDSYNDRSAEIVFKSKTGGLSSVLEVTQLSKNGLILSNRKINATCTEQTVSVTLQYNVPYSISSSALWISQTSAPTTKALESTKLYFKISANTGGARTGYVFVQSQDLTLSDTLTIAQEAFLPILKVKGEKSYAFDSKSHDFTVELDSNIEYSVTKPSWITKDGLKFTVAANSTPNDRSGEIIFKGYGSYSSVSDTVKVGQSGAGANVLKITHSATTFTVPTVSGSSVSGTVDWGDGSAKASYSSGITHTYSASGNYVVTISVYNNSSLSIDKLSKISNIDLSSF